jgi:hypothetical protein
MLEIPELLQEEKSFQKVDDWLKGTRMVFFPLRDWLSFGLTTSRKHEIPDNEKICSDDLLLHSSE